MKFFNILNHLKVKTSYKKTNNINYDYKKFYIANRKKITKVGNKLKNSNVTIVNKFVSISFRKGKKKTMFKHLQVFYQMYIFGFFFTNDFNLNKAKYANNIFDYDIGSEFSNYGFSENFFQNYEYFNLIKKLIIDESSFVNLNKLVNYILPLYNALFTIKVKKLNKKMKAKYKKKYLYKISYVYPKNRTNLTLKFINFQSLQTKNYYFSQRLVKAFSSVILAPKESLA